MKPPGPKRCRRRLGQVPVAGHDRVTAHEDLADLAGRERPVLVVDDRDFDSCSRDADGNHPALVAGLIANASNAFGMAVIVHGLSPWPYPFQRRAPSTWCPALRSAA